MNNTARKNSSPYSEQKRVPFRAQSNLTAVDAILSKVLARHGLERKVQQYRFVRHWESIVGKNIAGISKPEAIHGRTLVVRVVSSVWAQELSFLKNDILQRLKPFLDRSQTVNEIIFKVGLAR